MDTRHFIVHGGKRKRNPTPASIPSPSSIPALESQCCLQTRDVILPEAPVPFEELKHPDDFSVGSQGDTERRTAPLAWQMWVGSAHFPLRSVPEEHRGHGVPWTASTLALK